MNSWPSQVRHNIRLLYNYTHIQCSSCIIHVIQSYQHNQHQSDINTYHTLHIIHFHITDTHTAHININISRQSPSLFYYICTQDADNRKQYPVRLNLESAGYCQYHQSELHEHTYSNTPTNDCLHYTPCITLIHYTHHHRTNNTIIIQSLYIHRWTEIINTCISSYITFITIEFIYYITTWFHSITINIIVITIHIIIIIESNINVYWWMNMKWTVEGMQVMI